MQDSSPGWYICFKGLKTYRLFVYKLGAKKCGASAGSGVHFLLLIGSELK